MPSRKAPHRKRGILCDTAEAVKRAGLSVALLSLGLWGEAAGADPKTIHVVAVGDVAFRRQVGAQVALGTTDPFAAVAGSLRADLAFANLETVLSVRKLPEPKTSRRFPIIQSPPQGAQILARAGFGVVSVANNHVFDFFAPGFFDTLNQLEEAKVVPIGGGRSGKDAAAPFVRNVNGVRVGMLAFASGVNRAAHGNAFVARRFGDAPIKAVRALRAQVDVVLVSVHFGLEGQALPIPTQTQFAHAVIEAGADVVIGHHPHVLQSVEWYRGRPIFYSLGNFLFGKQPKVRRQSAILHLQLGTGPSPVRSASLEPILIREDTETPDKPSEAEAQEIFDRLRRASRKLGAVLQQRQGFMEVRGADAVTEPNS